MKVLLALTYYRPHVSGLTIYVERLAEGLVEAGHEATILTSHYSPVLARKESDNGVRVVRVPVAARVSKGVLMPSFPLEATRLMREHDVVSVHLPQFEASLLGCLGRGLVHRPVALTYHCDLRLPPGVFNRVTDQVVFASNWMAGRLADAVVAYTSDYADHSRFLRSVRGKVRVIPPPVAVPNPEERDVSALRQRFGLEGKPVIGFAARLATEKGVEYLLRALPSILSEQPDTHVLFAGEFANVLGEESYRRRLEPALARFADRWHFLGVLDKRQMATFYAASDVTVLPSINSTESFGLVQVESMLCGTPVVASDLPGVRVAVRTTGMGEIVPPRNPKALAEAVLRVLRDPAAYRRPRVEVAGHFSTERTVHGYVSLFEQLTGQVSSTMNLGNG